MKNLKVSLKLILSFMIVAALTAAVGVVGIVGMTQVNAEMTNMYDNQTVPIPYMITVVEMLQRQRACMREFIVASATGDQDLIEDANNRIRQYQAEMEPAMDAYYATISDVTELGKLAKELFYEAQQLYETSFKECLQIMYQRAREGYPPADMYTLMTTYTADVNLIVDNFNECVQMKIDSAAMADAAAAELANTLLILIIVVLVIAVAIAIIFALYISSLISKPLGVLSSFMHKAGGTGDISMTPAEAQSIAAASKIKDEIGQTILNTQVFIEHVTVIAQNLETVAIGDLTPEVKLLSEKDTMGKSLQQMIQSLNEMFASINSSTQQVSTGAKQVADGAQSLAQGSTEQAASIQELSASIGDIASSTKSNAEIAAKTAKLSNTIKDNAEKGSRQMDEMITAVKDINDASLSISKIIKTIDDIAFQTNILALNAAVEAARAGQHGKGFAVVAEEVRNLASKSAEAAKDTGDMIQNSMDKAELGSQIAGETAASLKEIVSGISESSELIQEIAAASESQSLGISQINTGVDQVAQVVQQNSATAQQSAAASQEMSSQSTMLEELISRFKLKDQGSGFKSLPSSPRKPATPIAHDDDFALTDNNGFGKY